MVSHIFFQRILALIGCTIILYGCQAQSFRLPTYIGPVTHPSELRNSAALGFPTPQHQIGFLVLTDSSFPHAAPPLSPNLRQIIENRLHQTLRNDFSLQAHPVRLDQELPPPGKVDPFIQIAKAHNHEFLLLLVLSSTDQETHAELGEERMMTRMPGVAIENEALAELAVLHIESGRIVFQGTGQGISSMELLDVPLGEDFPSQEDARDILRGNSAQKALDAVLREFHREWKAKGSGIKQPKVG